jgi:tetratricopeptide (TPR) repeat protein
MRYLNLVLVFCCFCFDLHAQSIAYTDTSLKFNQRYTKCEKKWVVLLKADSVHTYTFGYIYIDHQAGFTFDLKGTFKVDKDNKYIVDTSATKNTSIKYRISPNWRNVAILSPEHFKELNIKAEPNWLKYFYSYTDTVEHNYRWGWIYNDLGESAIALTYLLPAYNLKPHAHGVEFEMAFAFNVIGQHDNAIKILVPAIQNDPNNMLFYKELGYAYEYKKDYEKALNNYKQGLQHAPDQKSEAKGELAFNMANVYKAIGNIDEYKDWMINAKSYTPENSSYYKRITDAGF